MAAEVTVCHSFAGMNPLIEAALIGGGVSAIVAVVAFLTTRSTTRMQIESDRANRVWDQQAATYVDAIVAIRRRQKIRQGMWLFVVTGSEPEPPPASIDWAMLDARVIGYATNPVIEAFETAGNAGKAFEDKVRAWHEHTEMVSSGGIPGASPQQPGTDRDSILKALKEANRLDDVLIDTIRDDLHARAGAKRPAPVRLAPKPDRPAIAEPLRDALS
jgi:hypothetical protein